MFSKKRIFSHLLQIRKTGLKYISNLPCNIKNDKLSILKILRQVIMKWYVLYVKSRQEVKIESYINKLDDDIMAFCPTRSEIKKWSDRTKKVRVPLIPSVVLIKTREKKRDKVFEISGTIKYLFLDKKPAVVKEKEVQHLQSIAINKNIISHEAQVFNLGSKIDLSDFGFKDTKGTILKTSNNTCWVSLESLGYTLKLNY